MIYLLHGFRSRHHFVSLLASIILIKTSIMNKTIGAKSLRGFARLTKFYATLKKEQDLMLENPSQ